MLAGVDMALLSLTQGKRATGQLGSHYIA